MPGCQVLAALQMRAEAAHRAAGTAEGARPEDPGRMEPCGKFVFIRVRKVFFFFFLVCHGGS